MTITVENKSTGKFGAGFNVRITDIFEPFDYTVSKSDIEWVMGSVVDRMDNYYDANGLTGIEWKREYVNDKVNFIIDVCWNEHYTIPSNDLIIKNIKRWIEAGIYFNLRNTTRGW